MIMKSAEAQIENLRDRIEEADIIDKDREALFGFDDELTLLNSKYSSLRHLKLLRHCTIMAEKVGGIEEALTNRDAAETIVRWIHRTYENEETNQDYRVALKVFGRRVTDEGVQNDSEEPPASLAWIPSGTSKNYDPAPEPGQMVNWNDDVLSMIRAANHKRDKAAIALQYDAGLRGFEFSDLAVGDITDHDHGLQVTVDGKQGRRTVLLIPSVPYVRDWLEAHPSSGDRRAPLWSKLDAPEGISYRMLTKMFKKPAERADVDKPVTLTNFRKSSASYHASKGLSQPHLENRYGWVTGSSAASRYIKVFAKQADDELAKMHGLEVEEKETESIGPIPCPRCGYDEKREAHFCSRCGQAMRVEAAAGVEEAQADVKQSYAETDPADAETIRKVESVDELLEIPGVKELLADERA
jgi:integrase